MEEKNVWVEYVKKLANSMPIVADDGDYFKDKILYCGKCNTPKMCIHKLQGEDLICPIMCECKEKEIQEQKKFYEEYEKMKQIAKNRQKAFENDEFKQYTFETAEEIEKTKGLLNWCEDFIKNKGKIKGLLFYGETSRGKSYSATCIANRLIDNGFTVKQLTFEQLTEKMMSTYNKDEMIKDLTNKDLLILDELKLQKDENFTYKTIYSIIDSRYNSRKPIIITTNLSVKALAGADDVVQKRINERILEVCLPVLFNGKNFRLEKAKENYKKDKERWGL